MAHTDTATETDAQRLVKSAQALIDQVQGQLAAGEATIRELGLDPAKVTSVMEGHMGAKEWEEAKRLLDADMAAVEQEVQEGKARAEFSKAAPGTPARRPRPMV